MEYNQESLEEFITNIKKIEYDRNISKLFFYSHNDIKSSLCNLTSLSYDVINIINDYSYNEHLILYNIYCRNGWFHMKFEYESLVFILCIERHNINLYCNNRNNVMFSIIQYLAGAYRYKKNSHATCNIYNKCSNNNRYKHNLLGVINAYLLHKYPTKQYMNCQLYGYHYDNYKFTVGNTVINECVQYYDSLTHTGWICAINDAHKFENLAHIVYSIIKEKMKIK